MKHAPIGLLAALCLFASCSNPVGSGSKDDDKPTDKPPVEQPTTEQPTTPPATYAVTYDGNEPTSGTVPVDSARYPENGVVTVPGNPGSLAKTGFSFAGWNGKKDGSGTAYAQGATFRMGAGDVTLFARWTALPTYAVTYDANGGSGDVPVDSTRYLAGATVTVAGKGASLSKEGFSFSGWCRDAGGAGTVYAQGAQFAMGTADVRLYAVWTAEPTYSIFYRANGGTGDVPKDGTKYRAGDLVTIPDNAGNLTKDGFTFGGWNTQADGKGTTYQKGEMYAMGAADAELFARWKSTTGGGTVSVTRPDPVVLLSVPLTANYGVPFTATVSVDQPAGSTYWFVDGTYVMFNDITPSSKTDSYTCDIRLGRGPHTVTVNVYQYDILCSESRRVIVE